MLISRRELMRVAAGAAALAATGVAMGGCAADQGPPGAPTWLAPGFDRPALITLGGAYLATHPAERTVMALDAAIQAARAGRWPWSATRDLPTVVAREFANGDTVLVDGWLLSRTEARLCARMALSPVPTTLPGDTAGIAARS